MSNVETKDKIEIFNFEKELLAKKIIAYSRFTSAELIKSQPAFNYIYNYFKLKPEKDEILSHVAKTCVAEKKYVSQSFLTDHKNYYSTCFRDIPKTTCRIHFFSSIFSDEKFKEVVLYNNSPDEKAGFWNSYLGYVTIRPVGSSPFGVYVFKHYPEACGEERRMMNSTIRNLRFDVFGRETFLNSLAFQQRDHSVGACATFALWSTFHKLSKIYKSELLSPYEITKRAGLNVQYSEQVFPSAGFKGSQIIKALDSSGLTADEITFPKNSDPTEYLKELIYAYNKSGIPILFGYAWPIGTGYQYHLVSVVGFKIKDGGQKSTINALKNKAHSITGLYSHNDLIGPFAKIDFVPRVSTFKLTRSSEKNETLSSAGNHTDKVGIYTPDLTRSVLKSFQYFDGTQHTWKIAMPTSLWVPLESLVKIKYKHVLSAVKGIDPIFKEVLLDHGDCEWEVYLIKAVDYKQEHENFPVKDNVVKSSIANIKLTSYPKYIWIASFVRSNNSKLIDFVYDATSLPHGNCLFQINLFDEGINGIVEESAKKVEMLMTKKLKKLKTSDLKSNPYPNFKPYK